MRIAHATYWQPRITFAQLVSEMVQHDLEAANRDALIKSQGYKVSDPRE